MEWMVRGCGNGGDCGGRCVHRNRFLPVKAAPDESAKSPANTAFAARAAFTVAVVVVVMVALVVC